jgi:hypothetical protein
MLTAADMVSLPKGQAFALLEGGHLWKIRMPLPDTRGDDAMPEAFAEIAEAMKRTYITNDHWYRVRESWWHAEADGVEMGVSDYHDPSRESAAIPNG